MSIKDKGIRHWKISTPSLKMSNMLLRKSGRELPIAPKWMKRLGQSRYDTQLWMCLVMKVKSDAAKYFIGTWNVRSMNQGKLGVVKQEIARVNIEILGISELKWMGMGKFNTDDHYIHYCGQESHRRNGVALIINKRVQNAVLGCNLKNDIMFTSKASDSTS